MVPVAIQPIIQVGANDCGVAAVAMLAGKPYRTVSDKAAKVCPRAHTSGMWVSELKKLALACGLKVQLVIPHQDTDLTGLVIAHSGRERHFAVIFQGVIINPSDGQVWDLDGWRAAKSYDTIDYLLVYGR